MGGFFGAASKNDCVTDVFFGTDYHSHLGTHRGGMAILDGGVVAEQGTVAEIFADPQTDIGRQLVYPNGVQIDKLPASRVIRVAFNGGSSYEPLIASLAIDCGVKVNILGADTRNIDGKAFGTMLLGLPENDADAAKAIEYIQGQPNVTVEEVPYHG